jgi:hypothetical protein
VLDEVQQQREGLRLEPDVTAAAAQLEAVRV